VRHKRKLHISCGVRTKKLNSPTHSGDSTFHRLGIKRSSSFLAHCVQMLCLLLTQPSDISKQYQPVAGCNASTRCFILGRHFRYKYHLQVRRISKRGVSYLNYVYIDFCSYLLQFYLRSECEMTFHPPMWLQNVAEYYEWQQASNLAKWAHALSRLHLTWLSVWGDCKLTYRAKSLHPPNQLTNSVEQKLTFPQLFNRLLI
jgi:hypothetical protein